MKLLYTLILALLLSGCNETSQSTYVTPQPPEPPAQCETQATRTWTIMWDEVIHVNKIGYRVFVQDIGIDGVESEIINGNEGPIHEISVDGDTHQVIFDPRVYGILTCHKIKIWAITLGSEGNSDNSNIIYRIVI